MGISALGCSEVGKNTISDCFAATNLANLIVTLIYVSHLISAFPIYFNITRTAFYELYFEGKTQPRKVIIFADVCTLLFFFII